MTYSLKKRMGTEFVEPDSWRPVTDNFFHHVQIWMEKSYSIISKIRKKCAVKCVVANLTYNCQDK